MRVLAERLREYLNNKLPSSWDYYEEDGIDLPRKFSLLAVEACEVEIKVFLLRLSFTTSDIVKFDGRTTDPDLLIEAAAIMRDLKEIVDSWLKESGRGPL